MTTTQSTSASSLYDNNLYNFIHDEVSSKDPVILAEFKKLHRLNLLAIQNDLAIIKGEIQSAKAINPNHKVELRKLLRDYTQAIQDFRYMDTLAHLGEVESREHRLSLSFAFRSIGSAAGAPYDTRYLTLPTPLQQEQEPDAVREVLRDWLPKKWSWTSDERRWRGNEYIQGRLPNLYSPFVDRLARFLMAFLGGAALLVPMIVMVFNSSLAKSLIVTSIAVLLFAVFLALGIHSSNMDTLAATATYAAVLVVFVGTSLSSSSTGGNDLGLCNATTMGI